MSLLHSILGIFCLADLFLWWRSTRALGRSVHPAIRLALHLFFTGQIAALALFLWSAYHRVDSHFLPAPFLCIIFIWHILVAPLALAGSLFGLIVQAITRISRFAIRKLAPPPLLPPLLQPLEMSGLSRREFLGTLAALAPPVLTLSLGAAALGQIGEFRIRRLTLTLPSLPQELDGMTIAHLTDLHVGPLTTGPALKKMIGETNKLEADLLLFTGDLINSDLGYLPVALETLNALRPRPVLCEGNHDVGQNHGGFESQVKAAGFRLLVDETLTVHVKGHPVQLLGLSWGGPSNVQNRHDERGIAASMQILLQQRNPAAFPILLAHHPHAWDYSGDIPLTLSGHTHGGQLMLNERHGFGPLIFRYWSGLYHRPATSEQPAQALVVNNGIGNWFPLRTAAPAEIIHLTLRRG